MWRMSCRAIKVKNLDLVFQERETVNEVGDASSTILLLSLGISPFLRNAVLTFPSTEEK